MARGKEVLDGKVGRECDKTTRRIVQSGSKVGVGKMVMPFHGVWAQRARRNEDRPYNLQTSSGIAVAEACSKNDDNGPPLEIEGLCVPIVLKFGIEIRNEVILG